MGDKGKRRKARGSRENGLKERGKEKNEKGETNMYNQRGKKTEKAKEIMKTGQQTYIQRVKKGKQRKKQREKMKTEKQTYNQIGKRERMRKKRGEKKNTNLSSAKEEK